MPLTLVNKIKAFEYSIVRLAQWYAHEIKLTSFVDFNTRNDFGLQKILLFPFFICTSNGERALLFTNFCNKIYPNEFGLIDRELEDHISELSHVQIGLFNSILLNNHIDINADQVTVLGAIEYTPDEQHGLFIQVVSGIDTSIKCIREEIEYSDFVKLNWEAISYQSKEHTSWQVFSDPNILTLQPDHIIPSDFLIEEKSPFASINNKRMFAA